MINSISIRIRLVIMTMLILILCCIGLTVIINYSAVKMASEVASITTPAKPIDKTLDELKYNQIEEITLSQENYYNEKQQIIDTFYKNSILYMLFIIIIGGVMMYFFSKKILLPLTKLNEKIKSSTISNLSDKMEVPNANDEITELTISFNKMTDRIQESFIFQQQFSSNVAHELRTPLTILKTKIDVFNKKNRSIDEYKRLILDLENQILRLSDIVNTLLYLTNTEKIKEKEYIFISEIIDDILLDFSDDLNKKNLNFSKDFKDVKVYGNIDLLYQAFYNLIQNSIKYNVENGEIFIKARKTDKKTIIKILDTGIGIPKKEKQQIFEPFFRVDKSRSRLVGGAGLGLSIVKNIIDKHDASIIVSDNKPRGTCFTIELPFLD